MEPDLPESEYISNLWDWDLYHSLFSDDLPEPPVPSGSVPDPLTADTRERSVGDALDGHDQRDILANVPILEDQLNQTTNYIDEINSIESLERNSERRLFLSNFCERSREDDVSTYRLRSESTPRVKKPHVCVTCQKTFPNASSLKMHRLTHTTEKQFKCPDCPKLFKYEGSLYKHLKAHSNIRYPCDYCDKTFLNPYVMKQHVKEVHNQAKPFACDICEKSFARKRTMKEHRLTHTGEQPYKCMDCDRMFTEA